MLSIEEEVQRPQRKHLRWDLSGRDQGWGSLKQQGVMGWLSAGGLQAGQGWDPGWELKVDPDGMRVFTEESGTIIFTLPQLPLVIAPADGP